MLTNTQHVTLKSPEMSGNNDCLCRTKAIFADFSKSPKQ